MTESRPKVAGTRELEKTSQHKVEQIFCQSAGFDASKVPLENDYGIDYRVTLIDKAGNILSAGFVCQLKARAHLPIKNKVVQLSGFKVKTLNLLRKEALPAYLFLYLQSTDQIYWSSIKHICHALDTREPATWNSRKNLTVPIPESNILNSESAQAIYKETHAICTEIAEARPTLDLIAALKEYAKVDVEQRGDKTNMSIYPTKPGLGGTFTLATEEREHLTKAIQEGRAASASIKGGQVQVTFNGKKIYDIPATTIFVKPTGLSDELTLVIPETDYQIGPFRLNVKGSPTRIRGSTPAKMLPWFFKMEIDAKHQTSSFAFGFDVEFAAVPDYLQYLKFMNRLATEKRLALVPVKDPTIKIRLDVDNLSPVEEWRLRFFENLETIENHTGLHFQIPAHVSRDEMQLSYIYASLLSKGNILLPPSAKGTAHLKGSDLRAQASKLMGQGQLLADVTNDVEICGEDIDINAQFILDDAVLDAASRELLATIDAIDSEKTYMLGYESASGQQGRLVLKTFGPEKDGLPALA